ncbi:MAG: carboxylating nicotinate-nucleotide diphosphorylase [Luteitalea sp.]|nr:carboxylating nicotinate-nucleotide diphosphorylase [Luteitalea sp.]
MKIAPFAPLEPAFYREVVRRALAEDLGWGDVTTEGTVSSDLRGRGRLLAREPCVVAGLDVAAEAFRQLDPNAKSTWYVSEGASVGAGALLGDVIGRAGALLTAERTALNFLQRLCGIATLTRCYVEAAGGRTIVLDTRKTAPTLRALDKYAVRAGGGVNHRLALDDGILIKDNHIAVAGGVRNAVKRMKDAGQDMPIEVEVKTLDELEAALDAGADRILADNMDIDTLREVVRRARGRARVEISGGVTLGRVPELASLGAEFISVGAITHSAHAIDLSFTIEPSED